jgi:hypothetical protein
MKSDLHIAHVLCSRGGTRRVRRPSCVSCCVASFITESNETVVEAVSDVRPGVLLGILPADGSVQGHLFRGVRENNVISLGTFDIDRKSPICSDIPTTLCSLYTAPKIL